MLQHLHIEQFVIIQTMDSDFNDGLNVLTGETGAGKSILLDAMGIILGDEADREAIRQGSNETIIEATFTQTPEHPIWAFFKEEAQLDIPQPTFKVRRVFDRFEKDDITINGAPISAEILKKIGHHLTEIHGQGANQSFLSSETQLTLLDAFGGYPSEIVTNVRDAWRKVMDLTKALEDERQFLALNEREKINWEKFVTDVDKLGLEKDSYEEWKVEHARLLNAKEVSETFQAANSQLVAQSGAEIALIRVTKTLESQTDPALDTMKAAITAALEQVRVAIGEMQELSPTYMDVDLSNLRPLGEKLTTLEALAKASKIPPEKFYDYYVMMAAKLARIKGAAGKIKELDRSVAEANGVFFEHAHILTEMRMKASKTLSDAINAEMPPLRLPKAQIQVEVGEDQVHPSEHGINTVTFMARMNPGMPFSPMTKTASGGEMSRLILAIKMVLQRVQTVSTLVFDEVDAGIGGAEAAAVGNRIAKLAVVTQILIITHSPQVASCGNRHLHVSKKVEGGVTTSIVRTLTLEQRIHEISRMLAGEETTGESEAAAKALIDEAAIRAETYKAEHLAELQATKQASA